MFDLDGGEMSVEVTPGERALDGKLRIETGDSTKIMDLYADLQTVEERQQDGKKCTSHTRRAHNFLS